MGYGLRFERSPYVGGVGNRENQILYLYEGERAYLHESRVGLKFSRDAWRLDAFLQQRAEGFTQDRAPSSAAGMEFREPGIDAGLALRRETAWGTPYAELTRDVSNRSEAWELKLGYWNGWRRGRFELRPHAALALREADLNDYYYGVTQAEAAPGRPAYNAGAGVNLEAGLHASYRLTENWQVIAALTALRRPAGVRESPIVQDRLETAMMVGLLYDFSPQRKRWAPEGAPLILRTFYGFSSDCDVAEIVRLGCTDTHTKDKTDVWGLEAGRVLVRQPNGWPMDIAGFLGVVRHLEKGYQEDFWQVNAYAKVYYWGFPWDRWIRTRLGMATGLAYAEHIPEMEIRDQARRNRGSWKILNYLDPTVDFRVGDIIPARSLRDTYVGLGVSHRSGMFGKSRLFGDVNGGSNYIYFYVESSF